MRIINNLFLSLLPFGLINAVEYDAFKIKMALFEGFESIETPVVRQVQDVGKNFTVITFGHEIIIPGPKSLSDVFLRVKPNSLSLIAVNSKTMPAGTIELAKATKPDVEIKDLNGIIIFCYMKNSIILQKCIEVIGNIK